MAIGYPEKICTGERRKYRKMLKWAMRKFRRLQWRRFGENAAKKDRHYGWSV